MPYERDIYVSLLVDYLEKEKQRQQERASRLRKG